MTEAHKGLMTSKELGMAVADRLRQAEKRSEATPKQQALMRRALQPPASREQRADRQVALEQLQQGEKELAYLKSQPFERLWVKPTVTYEESREIEEARSQREAVLIPGESPWSRRNVDILRAKIYNAPPFTDEEWKEYEKIQTMPIAELLQKYGIPNMDGKFIPYVPDSPDRKTPEKRKFWEVIGEMIGGLFEGAVQSRKDKPADTK